MTREEAKELLPVIQAWVENKSIQVRINNDDTWTDLLNNELEISKFFEYRIKPEPKYRPFRNKEECWNEMHKHSDFGWVRYDDLICTIQMIALDGIAISDGLEINNYYFNECFINIKFTDGTPFGIKKN